MALTIGTLDSWTATTTTERTLDAAKTADGIYVAQVDAKNLAAGESLTIRCYLKIDSGETEQLALTMTIMAPLTCPLVWTPPITSIGGSCKFTVTQNNGTGRAFKGRVASY